MGLAVEIRCSCQAATEYFCSAFTQTLWWYGCPELEEAGWRPFQFTGTPADEDSTWAVEPSVLANWIRDLKDLSSRLRSDAVYAEIWTESHGMAHTSEPVVQAGSKKWRISSTGLSLWIEPDDHHDADESLRNKADLEFLESIRSRTQLAPGRCADLLAGTEFQLRIAPIVEYFRPELQRLASIAAHAEERGEEILYTCPA